MSSKTDRIGEVLYDIVSDLVDEKISDREVEVEAENVQGLEHEIENTVEKMLDDYEPDADNIRGLSDMIDDHVNSYMERELGHVVNNNLREHIVAGLETPEFQAVLDKAVQQSLLRLVSRLMTGLVPQAQPVQPSVRFNQEGGIIDGLNL